MYQLRNLINRSTVPSDPTTNMNAAEDFLLLLLHTHTVAAAKVILSYNPTDSATELASRIVANFVNISQSPEDKKDLPTCEDKVHLYGIELLSLTLIWHGFHDAIREGDGVRILRYWKFLLVIFKCSNKHNYAKEAVNLLLQYHYIFSERQREQLIWSRCVNTRGHQGTNIPCDLNMEHLVRRLKTAMRNLRANIKPSTVEKAGKCIGVVQHICQAFEQQTSKYLSSDHHSFPAFGNDFITVLKELEECSVFIPQCKRKHASFSIEHGLMEKLSKKDLRTKVETNIKQIYRL